jgi:hypothetical protein
MSSDIVQIVRQANAAQAPRASNDRKVIKKLDPAQRRIIGFGQQPDIARIRNGEGATQQERLLSGLGACGIIDAIRESANAPVWNMDIVEQVRWNLAGPLSQQAVLQGFDAGEINIFGNINVPPGVSVESTLVQPGQTQTYMVACYLGVHMEPDPLCFTAHGNAWTAPASTSIPVPLSPDVFTVADAGVFGGATNALGIPAGTTMTSAYLEWGWWANYASWNMVRGYNLKWKIGQRTNIMDDVLRHTAYMPPNGQEGSASNSMVDIANFVNRVNTYYTSPTTLASPLIFLKENVARVGSIQTTPGTPATNQGVFLPSRAGQLVPATYGGMDLRSMLKGNSEFRKLTLPYLIKPGVPIGLVFEGNQDTFAINQMQNYIDAQQGFATLPPLFTDAGNVGTGFSGTGLTPAGIEVPLNQAIPTSSYNFNEISNVTTLFKGGNFKISVMIRGFEVSEDWYQMMCADPVIRETVMNACGIHIAQLGA